MFQQLCQVSEIAYKGISNEQEVIFSDFPDDFDSLDLMEGVPGLYMDEGIALSYNFLHLTIQEFLAAFHLCQQSTEQQVQMFTLHQNTSSYKMVLKFMAGLTDLEDFSEDALLTLFQDCKFHSLSMFGFEPTSDEIIISLDCLHFLFEGGKWNILNTPSKVLNPIGGPFDCYILGYMLSHTTCQWIPKNAIKHLENTTDATMFARGTTEDEDLYPAEAGNISLQCNNDCIKEILKSSKHTLTRIEKLCIHNTRNFHACDDFCESLTLLPRLESLRLVDLSYTSINFSLNQPSSSHSPSPLPSPAFFTDNEKVII